jgi:hypothetical protein
MGLLIDEEAVVGLLGPWKKAHIHVTDIILAFSFQIPSPTCLNKLSVDNNEFVIASRLMKFKLYLQVSSSEVLFPYLSTSSWNHCRRFSCLMPQGCNSSRSKRRWRGVGSTLTGVSTRLPDGC